MTLAKAHGNFGATAARPTTDALDILTLYKNATAVCALPNAKNVLTTETMACLLLTDRTRPLVAITSLQFANVANCTILTTTVTSEAQAFSRVTTTLNWLASPIGALTPNVVASTLSLNITPNAAKKNAHGRTQPSLLLVRLLF